MLATKLPLRLVAGAFQAYTRVHSLPSVDASSHNLIAVTRRFYATPGRPKKAVGEASKAVKRTTKPKATAAKPKKVAVKKPAKAKKPRAPRPQTEEQRQSLELRKLKKTALDPPSAKGRQSPWVIFMREWRSNHPPSAGGAENVVEGAREAAREWKLLPQADRERYSQLAAQESAERREQLSKWVSAHTVEEISAANRARSKLHAKGKKYQAIPDDRRAKRPVSAYLLFFLERRANGAYTGVGPRECLKLAGAEWKALTDSEKEPYEKIAADAMLRHKRETGSDSGSETSTSI